MLKALARVVGEKNLLTSEQDRQVYGLDWTRFYKPDPVAVVQARDIDQVVALVRFANEHGLALVPSGGRTGLSAGAVAAHGEIVVSFDKMNGILDFNETDGIVVVQPGVVTSALQQFALDKGWFYPVDFASSGSSQIGGNIATNAGGIKVLRYGLTRQYVSGLKVVTGKGELLDLNKGLIKNATGYDLRHLFIGSEGTLGLIVEATIQLVRPPSNLVVALLSVPALVDVMSVLRTFRQRVKLTAFEFFSELALQHVLAHHSMSAPFGTPGTYYALIEFEQSDEGDLNRAMAAFEACVEEGFATDGIISQSEQQRLNLWKYREYISESISPFTPYKNDVAVRVSKVPAFLTAVETKVTERYPQFEIVWFGHIGDGNLHLNILKPADWEIVDFKRECEIVSEEVLGIVADFGGSISAEHGVGMLKRNQLKFSRSEAEIGLMRGLKQVFDPNGVMNPGKLLP
jgi:FAD/FMN-containing dehydrogenase